jgi:hypothetical protein
MLSVARIYYVDDRTINECGALGRMNIDRGNRNTRRKHSPVPLCPPYIPRDLGLNSDSRKFYCWILVLYKKKTSHYDSKYKLFLYEAQLVWVVQINQFSGSVTRARGRARSQITMSYFQPFIDLVISLPDNLSIWILMEKPRCLTVPFNLEVNLLINLVWY